MLNMLTNQKIQKVHLIKKGTKGRLSELGAYNYWYPGSDEKYCTEILEDVECEHLVLWKNQKPYLAFKVPAPAVRTISEVPKDQYVCVWILEKDIENGLQKN